MPYQINKEPFNPITLGGKCLLENDYEYKYFQNIKAGNQNNITSLATLSAFLP